MQIDSRGSEVMDRAGFGDCKNHKTDCFAYLNGRCRALCDGEFNGKKCSFYKEKKEYEKQERRYRYGK